MVGLKCHQEVNDWLALIMESQQHNKLAVKMTAFMQKKKKESKWYTPQQYIMETIICYMILYTQLCTYIGIGNAHSSNVDVMKNLGYGRHTLNSGPPFKTRCVLACSRYVWFVQIVSVRMSVCMHVCVCVCVCVHPRG